MQRTGFCFELHCRAGILCRAAGDDFLELLSRARDIKRRFKLRYPDWTDLRGRILCPNGDSVPRADLRAAFASLADKRVMSAVLTRSKAREAVAPARSEARTEDDREAGRFAASGDSAFCQAGVVAPPDSLTGETSASLGDSL